jgi:predicted nucleotide-binding protein
MSNVEASEDNVESPSTYGGHAYREYRKKEKKKRQEKKS